MRKRWMMGGMVVVALAAGGVWLGSRSAQANKPEDKPVDKPLEFTAREVALPQRLPLAGEVAFSGPLVAPNTVTVRSRASGTLVSLDVPKAAGCAPVSAWAAWTWPI